MEQTSSMRILYVINHMADGGAQALVAQWVDHLRQTDHDVDVCTVFSKGQCADRLESQGTQVHNLGLDPTEDRYRPRNKYDLRVAWRLARLIRRGRYDIVHAHLFPTSLFVALASYMAARPTYLVSEHNVSNRRRRIPLLKILDRGVYNRYARIIAVSNEAERSLIRWVPTQRNKVEVIPNSVDPSLFDIPDTEIQRARQRFGIQNGHKVIVFAGRLTPAKGADVLLEALDSPRMKEQMVRVLIAGDGPMADIIRERAACFRPDGRITLTGLVADIPTLLNLADLVVLPSRWEGLPMILLEAMACGRPVVATTVGGIPEVIEHGVNGLLVPPENPVALGESMSVLLGSPNLRRRLGTAARRTVCERFSNTVALPKLLETYETTLSHR